MSLCTLMTSSPMSTSSVWKNANTQPSPQTPPSSIEPVVWPKRSLAGNRCSSAMHRCVSSPTSLGAAMKSSCQMQMADNTTCLVDAKQVEIDFATLTSHAFIVRITAPSGEESPLMNFATYGHTEFFSPKQTGCGHGTWKFEVLQSTNVNGVRLINEENMYLDGVGSLFFTVGDDLRPKLSSQEFLRLPSVSKSCKRSQNVTN